MLKQRYLLVIITPFLFGISIRNLQAQSFVTNGSASFIGGDCYQLTPDASGLAGTIFSQNTIDLTQPFSIDATMFFGCKDVNGADGIVFILATSNTALGGAGGGLGYLGITPSFAVEYDDYFNGNFGDPTEDHVAILSMGDVDHNLPTALSAPVTLPNIEDCMDHCFLVTWNPVTQTLTSTLDDNTVTYTGDIVTNIFSGNAQVYYGFSSGTGSLSNLHRICFGPPAVDAMPDVDVCEGQGVELQADPTGIDWTWAPHPTLSDLNVSNPIATPTMTTTYTTIIEYSCGYLGYDTVVVTLIPAPVADASNNGPVCEGETLTLDAEGGNSYAWSGPMGYTSFIQDPDIDNIMTVNGGVYTVTVTDAVGCTSTATTIVDVDTGPTITFDPLPVQVCENLDPFQLTATPSGGIWSGEITPGGLFDPEYAGEGIHIITYTATNAIGCSNTEEISIEVYVVPDVLINQPGVLCEESTAIQLSGTPTGGIWEGEITIGGIFDPGDAGNGLHTITYTAEDGNGCVNSAEIVIEVDAVIEAEIITQGSLCGLDTIILMAIPPGGIWGGAVNPDGQILPYDLSAGSHFITYQLNDSTGCYEAEVTIDIQYPTTLNCPNLTKLCFNSTPVILHADPPGGIWSGAADANGLVDPTSLAPGLHMAVYTDTSTVCFGGGNSCWTYVEILDAPRISNVSYQCDSLSAFYTVSFSILGGDTPTYNVTGTVTGTILPGLPYRFLSDPIPSGSGYSFMVDDIHQCDPDTTFGSFICNCTSNAGTMDLTVINACEGDTISVIPTSGPVLDPDDSLIYVLHLGFPDSIILTGNSTDILFRPPLQTGVTYFVSAVVGNGMPGGGVDLSDPCLSVSFGTPIMWTANPDGYFTTPTTICEGESATISLEFIGDGPFDIAYSDGSSIYSVTGIVSGHSITVTPSSSTTYTLLNIQELSPPGCSSAPDTGIVIEVLDNYLLQQTSMICSGDSILLGGAMQFAEGIFFDSLLSISGCDSILETQLFINNPDTIYLSGTSCDTSLTGIFFTTYTNQFGCDSTEITTVTYVLVDTTLLNSTTCSFQDAGIFSEIYIGQSGCDSVVIETITFIPTDTTLLSGETCDQQSAGIFTDLYIGQNGCDSVVIETISFIPSDTTLLSGETCDANLSGTFTQLLSNIGGCDSLVIETIQLLPSDTIFENQLTCIPQETGTTTQVFMNIHGCDSILYTITSLASDDSCIVETIRKDVFIPNVFTPNNDGLNDLFLVFSKTDVVAKLPYLRIFDRWGGLVFERFEIQPNDPQQAWDGTLKDEPFGPGVFIYVVFIEYADGSEEMRTGDITLIR